MNVAARLERFQQLLKKLNPREAYTGKKVFSY
jgi:hypothetical protein